jgi:hypothetical protein
MSATVFDGAWDLSAADRLIVEAKRWGSRLRFAIMLLFYRARGRAILVHDESLEEWAAAKGQDPEVMAYTQRPKA